MGLLAQLVGLNEPAPAPPKFADTKAFMAAVEERYPQGTRIYEHFKAALALYGASPKNAAAKRLLVNEVSCCFISSPDFAAAFDAFYGKELGMFAARAPKPASPRARAQSPDFMRLDPGRHHLGPAAVSNRAADVRLMSDRAIVDELVRTWGWRRDTLQMRATSDLVAWLLASRSKAGARSPAAAVVPDAVLQDAVAAAVAARRRERPPSSARHLKAAHAPPTALCQALSAAINHASVTQGQHMDPDRRAAVAAAMAKLPNVTHAAKNDIFLFAAELSKGARYVIARYDAPLGRDELDLKSDERLKVTLEARTCSFQLQRVTQEVQACDMGSLALVCSIGHSGQPFQLFSVGGGQNATSRSQEADGRKFSLLTTRLGLFSATPSDVLAVVLAMACPDCLAWGGNQDYFEPTTPHVRRAFAQLGKLPEPPPPPPPKVAREEWILEALHKHGGEDWERVCRDPAFDLQRRGRTAAQLKAAVLKADPHFRTAPVPIEDAAEWAQCSSASCEKWRLLPKGVKAESLSDAWTCGDLGASICVSCAKPACTFEDQDDCPCHTSADLTVVLLTHDGRVARTYCSPNSAGLAYGLASGVTRQFCLAARITGRTAVLCFAKDLDRLRASAETVDGARVWALFETRREGVQAWWGGTVVKETGEGDALSYDVVYDDGSRATILANTLFAAPPQVAIKCAKPNAKAKALLTKATKAHFAKAAKASAGPPKRHTSTVVRETLERLVATVAGDKAPSRRSARAPAPKKEQEAPAAPPARATKRRK
jgi:hypothetical protein